MLRFLLFDIDDTLLNFRDAVEPVIATALAEKGITFTQADFAVYHRINNALWNDVAAGRLTREELYAVRWTQVLAALGIAGDGFAVETRFRYHLTHSAIPEPGAADTLSELSTRYTLCTASNAPQEQQEQRLKAAGLAPYFAHIFTSGGLGADKPAPLFFDRCLHALGNPPCDEVMMIGDSPEADILGGAAVGLRTCLVNTRGVTLPPACRPDYTVTTLPELCRIV